MQLVSQLCTGSSLDTAVWVQTGVKTHRVNCVLEQGTASPPAAGALMRELETITL